MKYQKPAVVTTSLPTAVIHGEKNSMHVDGIDPTNPLSTASGYAVDE